jgi:hypothetical protein
MGVQEADRLGKPVYDHVPVLRKAAEGIAMALDSQLSANMVAQSQREDH